MQKLKSKENGTGRAMRDLLHPEDLTKNPSKDLEVLSNKRKA